MIRITQRLASLSSTQARLLPVNTLLVYPNSGSCEADEAEESEEFALDVNRNNFGNIQDAFLWNSSDFPRWGIGANWYAVEEVRDGALPHRIETKRMLLSEARKILSKSDMFLVKSGISWEEPEMFTRGDLFDARTNDINKARIATLEDTDGWTDDAIVILFSEKTKEELEAEELLKPPMQVFFDKMATADKSSTLEKIIKQQIKELFNKYDVAVCDLSIYHIAALASNSSQVKKQVLDKIGVTKEFERILNAIRAEILTQIGQDPNSSTVFSALRDNVRFGR